VLSADFPPFRPLKLLKTAHLQTVGAYIVRGKQSGYSATKYVVPLSDGDRLVIHDDRPESWITGDRIAIIFHGLCGCHLSPYVVRVADKLNRRGIRTIRVDMRGYGDSTLISKSHLHGGCYQDVESVVDFVHQLSPISKLSLVGFSIGGNVILKTLGVWGENPHGNVDSAVAVSPPVDLIHCSWNLRQRGNRIYEKYFISRMHSQLTKRRRLVKDLVDNQVSPLPTRLIHWDDQFTAPCWGYRGAREYYEDASSAEQLAHVKVPTIVLTAQDDPVVPFGMYSEYAMSDFINLISTTHGGHLGFISQGAKDPDRHWMDWRICQWVTSLDEDFGPVATKSKVPSPHRRRTGNYVRQP
jgi:predicted alpha/beta-fold hydrolase